MSRSRTRERRQQKEQASRKRNLIVGGIAAVAVVAIVAVILVVRSSQLPDLDLDAIPDASVEYPIVGADHIEPGDPQPEYNSNPPTSGAHGNSVRAGVYLEELADENLVHNLEHGHIWLSYRDEDDSAAIETLTSIQEQFPTWVVVTHRPANDDRVAAAAWGRLLTFDEVDADAINAFILRYRNQAPESVPG